MNVNCGNVFIIFARVSNGQSEDERTIIRCGEKMTEMREKSNTYFIILDKRRTRVGRSQGIYLQDWKID